jgi:hypothetical protein
MSHVVLAAANNFYQQHVGCIHSGIAASLQISACKQEANGSMEAGKQQRRFSNTARTQTQRYFPHVRHGVQVA